MKYSAQDVIDILEGWKLSIDNMKDVGLFSMGDARVKKGMLDFLLADFEGRKESHKGIEGNDND